MRCDQRYLEALDTLILDHLRCYLDRYLELCTFEGSPLVHYYGAPLCRSEHSGDSDSNFHCCRHQDFSGFHRLFVARSGSRCLRRKHALHLSSAGVTTARIVYIRLSRERCSSVIEVLSSNLLVEHFSQSLKACLLFIKDTLEFRCSYMWMVT